MNKYNQKWKREVTWAETYWYTENGDIVTSAWEDSNGKGWVGRAFSHKYGEIEIFKRDTFSEIMKHTHTINLGQETAGPVITNLNRKVSENLINSQISKSTDTAKLRARIKELEEQAYEFKRMIDSAWVGTMAELINLTLTSKCKYMLIKLPQEKDCEKK